MSLHKFSNFKERNQTTASVHNQMLMVIDKMNINQDGVRLSLNPNGCLMFKTSTESFWIDVLDVKVLLIIKIDTFDKKVFVKETHDSLSAWYELILKELINY